MEVREISSPDAINASSFVLIKYVIEKLLDAANAKVDNEDPLKGLIRGALGGQVEEDAFSQILMGYCVAEPGTLGNNIDYAIKLLKDQIAVLEKTIGG